MLKLVRLMRLGRMVTFLKANKSLKLSMILVQLLFILILIIHWIACLWLIVVDQSHSWFPTKDLDWSESEIYTSTPSIRYLLFFYYSVMFIVSNDLCPTTQLELMVSTVILLVGSITIGVVIGEFSTILHQMGEKQKKISDEFDMV